MVSATAFLLLSTCGDTQGECLHTNERDSHGISYLKPLRRLVGVAQRAEGKVILEGPLQNPDLWGHRWNQIFYRKEKVNISLQQLSILATDSDQERGSLL